MEDKSLSLERSNSDEEKCGFVACCKSFAACGVLICSCLVCIIVIGLIALGIPKLVMGFIYMGDCSIERMIPYWLIVSAIAPALFGGLRRRDNKDNGTLRRPICVLIGLIFNLVWLICGTSWVYPTYNIVTADDFKPCPGNVTKNCTQGDCNESLIKFAFAMATIDWICIGFWIILICCFTFRKD